ncbi:MAG: FecR domain-containing protein [Lachnospiraceae bacterium]|jgi:transmembrane sensor|uniref:FecR protein domain-containing protein n=1 Tax=bioreactor metagenome TaxID=1076179 RepID=A0A644WXG6_9ZZZZ|nr:FecR domain-containing protein [Lachnospiraceae bacterium]MEA4807959.1 FecR domain-containing protein [Macellibacteroides fermentans]HRG13986.1 FecR domain-containing protein [Macellibacteroides fermentans]
MNETEIMQELAFAYFAGKISKADEKKLFEFIQKEEQNYQQFKDWERAWMLSEKEDLRTAREWESLQCRIRTHEAVNPMISKSGSDLWRWAVAIAAMFVLIAGGTWVVLNTTTFMNKAQYIVFEAPYGEKSKMTFPDGTVVWLNAGSSLKYSNKYNTDDRVVELEGEGYFEVAKKKKIPFVVHTRGYDVVVKGTKFNVTAYPEDSNITTTLMEGAVELLKEKQHIAMKPGESVTLNVVSGKFTLTKVNPDVSKAWSENRIEYDNISLRELAAKLSRQYDVKIHLLTEEVGDKRFSISLRNQETIGEVMSALKEIIPIQVERKNMDIYIK